MLNDREIANLCENFSRSLREGVKAGYGRIPSAAFLSREFNMRHRGLKEISSESFRRWLHGLSIPRPDHLQTLVAWLNLDLNRLYCSAKKVSRETTKPRLPTDLTGTSEISQLMCLLFEKLSETQRQEISAIIGLQRSQKIAA